MHSDENLEHEADRTLQDLIIVIAKKYCSENQLTFRILARKPRLRFRVIGGSVAFGSWITQFEKYIYEHIGGGDYEIRTTSGSSGDMSFSVWKKDENPWQEAADKRKVAKPIGKQTSKYWAPHCDSAVLHAPGTCQHCDMFPVYQQYRVVAGINFTGETDPKKSPCPATTRRTLEKIERWSGNVPRDPGSSTIPFEG